MKLLRYRTVPAASRVSISSQLTSRASLSLRRGTSQSQRCAGAHRRASDAQGHIAEPAIAGGDAVTAAFVGLGHLRERNAGQVFLNQPMRGRFADKQEVEVAARGA